MDSKPTQPGLFSSCEITVGMGPELPENVIETVFEIMGSSVSIVNETNCILNISLRKGAPLYYENKVLPGQTVRRDVGKIWFSVEARLWNGLNEYDDFSEIVAPISTMSSAAVMGIRGLAAKAGLVNEMLENKDKQHVLIGKVILPVGASESSQKIISEWISDCVVREDGVFMSSDKIIRIVGGPATFIDEGNEYQYVETTEAFTIITNS